MKLKKKTKTNLFQYEILKIQNRFLFFKSSVNALGKKNNIYFKYLLSQLTLTFYQQVLLNYNFNIILQMISSKNILNNKEKQNKNLNSKFHFSKGKN